LQSLDLLSDLYDRGIVIKPKYRPAYFNNAAEGSNIINYLIDSIK
jgi:hypothetical protein